MAFMRTALNALDGMVARELNVEDQQMGEVLNEFFDRLSDSFIFLGIIFASYSNTYLGVLALVVILLNSYLSILSKAAGGSRQYGGFMGKADRMIYLGVLAVVVLATDLFLFVDWFILFILLGTIITCIQRFNKVKKELIT